jgi:phenylacetate-CoA ligase
VEANVKAALRDTLGVSTNVSVQEPLSIQRSEGKAKRVVDRRKL